jgi:hypothetical protein
MWDLTALDPQSLRYPTSATSIDRGGVPVRPVNEAVQMAENAQLPG